MLPSGLLPLYIRKWLMLRRYGVAARLYMNEFSYEMTNNFILTHSAIQSFNFCQG